MNPANLHSTRVTCTALGLAAATTLGVLLALGALADRYHADEAVARGAAGAAQQAASASAPPARG